MRERSQTELVRVSVFHMESTYVLCVCQREKRERESCSFAFKLKKIMSAGGACLRAFLCQCQASHGLV